MNPSINRITLLRTVAIFCGMSLGLLCCDSALGQHPLEFEVHLLTVDANEGCDIADVDRDGNPDVIAGRNWFRNGDWAPRPLRSIPDWNGYVESNGDFAYDVNGDGWIDVVAGGFLPSEVLWYQNPGEQGLARGSTWQAHLLVDTRLSQNEASFLHDIDGDQVPEWITNSWKRDNPLVIWRFKSDLATGGEERSSDDSSADVEAVPQLIPFVVGDSANGHGIGFGDLNNDGREDILVGSGWYECPAGGPYAGAWTYHADWDRQLSCPVLVRDINHDGMNDVLWGNPHDFGLFIWFGQEFNEDGSWSFDEQQIDAEYSQPHCVAFADLDGDGHDELITGKRVRAHNGNDPGGDDPALICYYTFGDSADSFQQHLINRGEVGIGLQIRTNDMDGDGDLDIVVAGKDGTQILFNQMND